MVRYLLIIFSEFVGFYGDAYCLGKCAIRFLFFNASSACNYLLIIQILALLLLDVSRMCQCFLYISSKAIAQSMKSEG